jgi:Outer membrane protein beta-barrel domain
MKHSLFVLFVLVTTGQYIYAQVGVAPEIGVGMSTYKFAPPTIPDYTSASVTSIFSWKAGLGVDIPFSKHFYFQPGLFISQKGAKTTFSYHISATEYDSVQNDFTVKYMELPVQLVYKTGVQGRGRVVVGIAAVPSYIFGGKVRFADRRAASGSVYSSDDTYVLVGGRELHAFDIGVNFCAGYELASGLFFRLFYNTGSNNIAFGNEVIKNRMYGITAGHVFGKGRNIKKETSDLIDKSE